MAKPLCIELFAGLHGWGKGFLAEGYRVVGFDIEDMSAKLGLPRPQGDLQLVLQDVLTLHGSQFRNADCIVASPPCQEFSRYAMPFGSLWLEHNRMDDDGSPVGNYAGKNPVDRTLFSRCFTLQRQATAAAGRRIPLIVENVRGAQPWIGPAAWSFGSFYLWGDVPALMPTEKARKGSRGLGGTAPSGTGDSSWFFGKRADPRDVRKTPDGNWELADGSKFGGGWWNDSTNNLIRKASSRSLARKAASAQIAKIPFPLARWIAQVYKPDPKPVRLFG